MASSLRRTLQLQYLYLAFLPDGKVKTKNKGMPIFFQQQINETTRLGVWKIEETESFFLKNVPVHREVTHPHKRLQHLAGRFLLQFLFPSFPYDMIRIADTKKPFLGDDQYHFSISHCGDYAAAIVSSAHRVGIDIEIPVEKIKNISQKFLHKEEYEQWGRVDGVQELEQLTLLWSAKEAVFKWYGLGKVDFSEHIRIYTQSYEKSFFDGRFTKTDTPLEIYYRSLPPLVLTWVMS